MTDKSIREKIGVQEEGLLMLMIFGGFFLFIFVVIFSTIFGTLFESYPYLVSGLFVSLSTLGAFVHLGRKYLNVREMEAEPSATEKLKQKYVEEEEFEIMDYESEYEKLEELEKN